MTGRPKLTRVLLGVALVVSLPAVAAAQGPRAGAWEVEAHGGLGLAMRSMGGEVTLPPAGPAIPTTSPTVPTREVPSWFFGDGASLLNDVNEDFGAGGRILPLEQAFESFGISQPAGVAGGVRLRRVMTATYAVELSLDLMAGSGSQTDDFLAAARQTADSFGTAFNDLFATGPFANATASARLDTISGSDRQVAITVALVQSFGQRGGFVPYLTGGGGMTTGAGTMGGLTLRGDYQFDIVGEVPIAESDALTLEFDNRTTWVGVVGGGIRRDMSDSWGISLDGRVLIGPNPVRARVSTNPSVQTGTPADFIETYTTPAVQFSNNPSTGRRSSLGGNGLSDVELFLGKGVQTRVNVTFGVFLRF